MNDEYDYSPLTDIPEGYLNNHGNKQSAEQLLIQLSDQHNANNSLRVEFDGRNS